MSTNPGETLKDFFRTVCDFYEETKIEDHGHHRYKSWEHCYKAFENPYADKEKLALHLTVYLASWGMYRGSSFMLEFDFKIHEKVISLLIENHALYNLNFIDFGKNISRICDLHFAIQSKYAELGKYRKNINTYDVIASETLTTKIMMGTLGCIPAYDRFFKEGLKSNNISSQFTVKAMIELNKYLERKKFDFKGVAEHLRKHFNAPAYPDMKLIDMYFFQIARKQEIQAKKKAA